MQFTSNVGFSADETPITLDWAEENFELIFQGMFDMHFLINRQADCFLVWSMDDDGIERQQLYLHRAVFDVEYVEEVKWICESFGIKVQKDEKMTLIAPMNLKYKTPITQDLIKEKFAPTIKSGTLSKRTGTIRYMIDKKLKLWVNFEEKIKGKSKIYIDCLGCECKLEVKYMEQIDWVIKKLKKTEKEIRNRVSTLKIR